MDLRSDTAATFNNNVILDQNGEVRQSRVAAGDPNTFTAGSVTFNAARTLTVNANGNLTNNLPYGLNISTVALPAAATGTIQVLNNGSGLGTVTASGAVSGIGSNLVKSGPGTLTLNFVATYTGTTAINQGTIVAGTDNVLSGAVRLPRVPATPAVPKRVLSRRLTSTMAAKRSCHSPCKAIRTRPTPSRSARARRWR